MSHWFVVGLGLGAILIFVFFVSGIQIDGGISMRISQALPCKPERLWWFVPAMTATLQVVGLALVATFGLKIVGK